MLARSSASGAGRQGTSPSIANRRSSPSAAAAPATIARGCSIAPGGPSQTSVSPAVRYVDPVSRARIRAAPAVRVSAAWAVAPMAVTVEMRDHYATSASMPSDACVWEATRRPAACASASISSGVKWCSK